MLGADVESRSCGDDWMHDLLVSVICLKIPEIYPFGFSGPSQMASGMTECDNEMCGRRHVGFWW